jgi:hypothetical protein
LQQFTNEFVALWKMVAVGYLAGSLISLQNKSFQILNIILLGDNVLIKQINTILL